jgi:hypothetical protein
VLESGSLSLEWTAADRVAIACATTGTSLGLVQRPERAASWWRRRGPDLEVLEGADRALLFTLRRYWLFAPYWLVDDSEENRVGRLKAIQGRFQFDRADSPIVRATSDDDSGTLVESATGQEAVILSRQSQVLGKLVLAPTRTEIQFRHEVADPFTRMLILAMGLLWRR